MSRGSGAPWRGLAVFAGVLVAGIALVLALPRLWGAVAPPETEIITQLKAAQEKGLLLKVSPLAPELKSTRVLFDRVTVSVGDAGLKAQAISTLDFDGKLGATKVSSLGLERTPFALEGGRWVAVNGEAPILERAVAALEARRRALESGDRRMLAGLVVSADRARALANPDLVALLAMSGRKYVSKAWYLRSKREGVVVTEQYRLTGTLPDRPVDEEGRRRLFLVPNGGKLSFRGGLM